MVFREYGPTEKDYLSAIMGYYSVLRNTIHGVDKIMVNIIYQSIALITGALTLSVVCFEKIGTEPLKTLMAIGLTALAFFLTWNSKKRIKLYIDIQGRAILIAKKIEKTLLKPDSFKINKKESTYRLTHEIEENVTHAGIRGEGIYKRAVIVFYAVEAGFLVIYLFGLIRFLNWFDSSLNLICPKVLSFVVQYLH